MTRCEGPLEDGGGEDGRGSNHYCPRALTPHLRFRWHGSPHQGASRLLYGASGTGRQPPRLLSCLRIDVLTTSLERGQADGRPLFLGTLLPALSGGRRAHLGIRANNWHAILDAFTAPGSPLRARPMSACGLRGEGQRPEFICSTCRKPRLACPPRRLIGGVRDRFRARLYGWSSPAAPAAESSLATGTPMGQLSAGLGAAPRLFGYTGYTAVLNLIKKDVPVAEDAGARARTRVMHGGPSALAPTVRDSCGDQATVGMLVFSKPALLAPLASAAILRTRRRPRRRWPDASRASQRLWLWTAVFF